MIWQLRHLTADYVKTLSMLTSFFSTRAYNKDKVEVTIEVDVESVLSNFTMQDLVDYYGINKLKKYIDDTNGLLEKAKTTKG